MSTACNVGGTKHCVYSISASVFCKCCLLCSYIHRCTLQTTVYITMYSVVDFCTVNFSISNGTSSDTAGQDVVQMLEKAFHQVLCFVQTSC